MGSDRIDDALCDAWLVATLAGNIERLKGLDQVAILNVARMVIGLASSTTENIFRNNTGDDISRRSWKTQLFGRM
jgi:hypothetical protein